MSPLCVEIYQIDKAESAEIFVCKLDGLLHSVDGGFGFVCFRDAFSVENVLDLSNGNHIETIVLKYIQRRLYRRLQRIVMTVARPFEFAFLLSDIRSCNDSSDSPLFFHRQFSCNFAATVQFL